MENSINQYKFPFLIIWILCYFLYPSWVLPLSVTERVLIFFVFFSYFSISAFIMNKWFNDFTVNKPIVLPLRKLSDLIRDNLWFFIILCIAVVLNLYLIAPPIMMIGDESIHLQGGLWIYRYIDSNYHHYFQIAFWVLVLLFFLLRLKNKGKKQQTSFLGSGSNVGIKVLFICCSLALLYGYITFYSNFIYHPSVIRYPPLSRLIYYVVYLSAGINHLGPRIVQLLFYLLCSIYLYRIIVLFSTKEAALIGASIYLFLPITFFYAHTAELGHGTTFFIIAVSYYFLRFLDTQDNRDLLLTSFFIGSGFMYKRIILLMFILCVGYLFLHKLRGQGLKIDLFKSLKVMFISLIPIAPWMIIGRFFSWRNYDIVWSNMFSIDRHASFLQMISTNTSLIIFVLFLISIVYVIKTNRTHLTLFFSFHLMLFYLFLVADVVNPSARLAMAFYLAITIFLSQLVIGIIKIIKWKHSFKIIFILLMIYLVSISAISPINAKYYHEEKLKTEYFPTEDAFEWIKGNLKQKDKLLTLRIFPAQFYRDKFGIDREKIIDFWFELGDVSTPEKLTEYLKKHDITHIMFPYGPLYRDMVVREVLNYLVMNPENLFDKVASFNIDDNYIYIYQSENINR